NRRTACAWRSLPAEEAGRDREADDEPATEDREVDAKRHEWRATDHDLAEGVAEVRERHERGHRPEPVGHDLEREEDAREEHQRELDDAGHPAGGLLSPREGRDDIADRDERQ